MQLTIKCLNALTPTLKLARTKLVDTNIYIEQRPSGYSVIYRYKSPATFKYRFYKLFRFTYTQKISVNDIKNIKNQQILLDAEVIKGVDPLAKKAEKDK